AEADVVETATLYVDGEAVVTVSNTDLPGNDKTAAEGTGRNHYSNMEAPLVITLSYKPHTFGTLQAFIELKSGDDVVTTEVVDVTIAEEKTESLIAIGEEKTTSTNVPFYALWGDDSKGLAECDVLYTAEILTKFGLKKDDKISAINFPGTPTGTKTFNNLTVEAWVGLLGANESFVAGEADKGNMQYVKLYDAESVTFTTDETVDFTITLPEPIVWDGVSDLRVTTNLNGNGTYLNIKFNVDNTYTNNGNYSHGGGTWNSTYLPVAYITLDVQANTLSGIVTEEDETTPVAGATVTIRNAENDIEYFATTNEAGAYTINVVQNSLTYTATVTAEGYETLVDDEELNFTENSLTKSYQLIKTTVPVVVTIGQYGYATFYYSNSAYVIPDDVEAKAVESINGKTLSLIPVSGIIPAGCAVILEGEQGDYTFEPTSEEGIAVETILRGTDNKEMIEAEEQECKYYKLTTKDGKVGFYYGAENGAIFENEAHKAYLPVPVSQSNGVNFFTFDDATGIKQLQTNDQETERFYNLSGQRVNDSYKGVVIVNGKKALKK
ncbi:MAG: carboxypeptidase regulatory-like domain-containing protein, partial [Prevotella sp.]|nr:carboxypeptidase regulatory-like domain-containing protein [Prevotella sp.]